MTTQRPIPGRRAGGATRGTDVATAEPTTKSHGARRGVVALTAFGVVAAGATVAVAEVTTPNETHLVAVGPTSGVHGFPVWYEDNKGLRLEQCLDATLAECDPAFLTEEGLDPEQPLHIGADPADSNFPGESFYYQAVNSYDLPTGGQVDFVSALEATFANEEIRDGDQVVFGRIRIRIDGLVPGEKYTVTHPYGADTFTADGEGEIRFVEDKTPAPDNFGLALGSRVSPFLVRDLGADGTPDFIGPENGPRFIGDPAVETTVTGSSRETNFVDVEGPGLEGDLGKDDTFVLLGRVSTNSGIDGVAAYRINNPEGQQDYVDVYATAGPNDSVQVSGSGLPLTVLAGTGSNYYARIPVAEDTFPAGVTVTNASDVPVAEKTMTVTDNVVVTQATYDDGDLTVSARSSDTSTSLRASVGGTALEFTDGTATVTGLPVPPATVTVTSSNGGSDTAPVLVTRAEAGSVVPVTATVAGISTASQGQSITLDASSSTNVTAFSWAQTGGATQVLDGVDTSAPTITFTAPTAGPDTLVFTLTTTGPAGEATSTHTVEVLDAAVEPTVGITASSTAPEVGETVTLTADATNAASYVWTQTAGAPISDLTLTGPSLTFRAPNHPVSFSVTVTSPGSLTATDTVDIVPNVDQVAITAAELRTRDREWRINGTATVTQLNTVTVHLATIDGTKGAQVGTATVDVTGAWTLRVRNGLTPPSGYTRLIAESSKGGVSPLFTFTSRR